METRPLKPGEEVVWDRCGASPEDNIEEKRARFLIRRATYSEDDRCFIAAIKNNRCRGKLRGSMVQDYLYVIESIVIEPSEDGEWFAGPCVGSNQTYAAERVIGIDTDISMIEQAVANFARLPHSETVQLIPGDARSVLVDMPGPFDFLYIEAKNENAREPEGLYLELLKQVYDRLVPNARVIAHDSISRGFSAEMTDYLSYVRDSGRFSQSVAFEIDQYGLELSVK